MMDEPAPVISDGLPRYEGSQDETNRRYVAGWAWDRHHPNEPVQVEVYDGEKLVGTVLADQYRRDLRDAGKGNGRHGFYYSLEPYVRGRGSYCITTRVAGTDSPLLDGKTGAPVLPITRRTAPPHVPDVVQSRRVLWFYYTVLKAVLSPFPWPLWRLPALVLGATRAWKDVEGRHLVDELLLALDRPGRIGERWRLYWERGYRQEAERLMLLQARRFSRRWLYKLVRTDSVSLPPGGAVLISPHHSMHALGGLALSTLSDNVAAVSGAPREADAVTAEPANVLAWNHVAIAVDRVQGAKLLPRDRAGHAGLEHLRRGGYLMVYPDVPKPGAPNCELLGRGVSFYRGAAWFAEHAHKPIVPWVTVRQGFGWRLWAGDPLPATQEAVIRGLEACIAKAPASWQGSSAMTWRRAPGFERSAPEPHDERLPARAASALTPESGNPYTM